MKTAALLLLLALAAQAQPMGGGPPPGPDPRRFVEEVRRFPTTVDNVHARVHRLMDIIRFSGRPPSEAQRKDIEKIRRLLRAEKLSAAAPLVDQVILGLFESGPRPAGGAWPSGPPIARSGQPPPAAPAAAPAELGAPILLSEPTKSRPIEHPAPPAEFSQTAPSEAQQPQAPGRPWWPIAAVASSLVLAGAAVLLVVSRRAPERAAAPPRSLTEKYSLGRVIASGGMGEVYEGRDLKLGRRVAIKRMLAEVKLDAALRAQFLKEARTVAKLSHPYIIPIHDCLESGGDLYLVFEYVAGETLARVLQREGRLPLKDCRRIFQYVCPAVDHAHQHHILHRDLKPANIMIDANGIARVMDFGIALDSTRTTSSPAPALLDASGTLRYMPPEQHYGRSVRASDVYALGVCLYEMAAGHPPFSAGSVDELIAMKQARRFPPPSTLLPELPKELDLFIAAVLEPDPGRRVPSAAEFLELLSGLPGAT
ncbi:MAG: serine/threonine-protein kinase [Elusimicrobia bacterium]|nr:serine/threonine-protein kinase [Elusimicrobiota bacterium]